MASSFQEQAPDRTILTGLRNTDNPRGAALDAGRLHQRLTADRPGYGFRPPPATLGVSSTRCRGCLRSRQDFRLRLRMFAAPALQKGPDLGGLPLPKRVRPDDLDRFRRPLVVGDTARRSHESEE